MQTTNFEFWNQYLYWVSVYGVSDVWGFDEAAVQVLQSMRPADVDNLVQKYAILLDPKSQLLPQNGAKDSVSFIVLPR